jgi:hypothetical protein
MSNLEVQICTSISVGPWLSKPARNALAKPSNEVTRGPALDFVKVVVGSTRELLVKSSLGNYSLERPGCRIRPFKRVHKPRFGDYFETSLALG